MPLTLIAAHNDNGRRLDRILRKNLVNLPLSAIHRLLRQGLVRVNGKTAAADYRILSGETITVDSDGPVRQRNSRIIAAPTAEAPPEILFEDPHILVLNKPGGLAVHGKNSLEDQVLFYLKEKIPPSLSFRPGPLHRLDKPTSGAIAFSTSLEGARLFSALMGAHKIQKTYIALVLGVISKTEIWEDDLVRDRNAGKTITLRKAAGALDTGEKAKYAFTRVIPLASESSCTLIMAEIKTGRTHQIRAQAQAHGHPLLGDRKYGGDAYPDLAGKSGTNRSKNDAFFLHAACLEFPEDSPFPKKIEAPLPELFQKKIREIFKKEALKLHHPLFNF